MSQAGVRLAEKKQVVVLTGWFEKNLIKNIKKKEVFFTKITNQENKKKIKIYFKIKVG